jgi:hypothetical protein
MGSIQEVTHRASNFDESFEKGRDDEVGLIKLIKVTVS